MRAAFYSPRQSLPDCAPQSCTFTLPPYSEAQFDHDYGVKPVRRGRGREVEGPWFESRCGQDLGGLLVAGELPTPSQLW